MKSKDLFYLILCLSLLLLSPTLHGQHFSIKGGLSAANVTGDMIDLQWGGSYPTRHQTTFHLEASVIFPLSSAFSIQTGIKYIGKGHRHHSQGINIFPYFGYVSEVSSQIFYADLPLAIKFTIPKVGCETYVFVGGYVGIGLHGKRVTTNTFIDRSSEMVERNIQFGDDGDYQRLDYGGHFGVGLHFGSLIFEVSYSLGIPDLSIASDPSSNNPEENMNRNRLLSVSLGYRLMNIGSKTE
jgi:hypothetical protein